MIDPYEQARAWAEEVNARHPSRRRMRLDAARTALQQAQAMADGPERDEALQRVLDAVAGKR